ncbi:glycosyltransferase family 2 protein [Escherichia coli]|uniref:glycosyltransferase family 2 protein n=1 Tax=Escherichia coli TaxID=562 RepID=UPI0002D48E56|nr:glycosyltransferase family 2 protein [Escherichia coli]EEQ2975021.1 glycosyltransferase family 2 protein [Escherichia coli]EER2756322.1 glycosyltransferase family 2 protein [Escherichia coli]EEZ2617466.1 glycosyltransferase family 2 protein [Escherichia coli]EFA1168176.1 glycosyltransferase family 2 protein [Escherichia coli]EFA5986219.1 glycosyltransferase family 2 protein [Escherichia coli]
MANITNKFSVIISAYNSSLTLDETLSSVLSQTLLPLEVIVVDDCSIDSNETYRICEKYRTSLNLKYIRHQINMNGAAARNTGINISTGDYVCFLDADDIWLPNKLALINTYINHSKSPEKCLFFSQLYLGQREQPNETCMVYPKTLPTSNKLDEYLFVYGGLIQTSTIVCHRILALDTMFDERFKRHQDYDFIIRLSQKISTVSMIPHPLVKWVTSQNGRNEISKGETPEYCQYWINEMKKYMSSDAICGYMLYQYTRRAFNKKHYFLLLKIVFHVTLHSSFKFKKIQLIRVLKKYKNQSNLEINF